MTFSWRDLPGPARGIGTAVTHAVHAAGEPADYDGYQAAVTDLTGHPLQPVGLVLATVVRVLLEERHPDGLDSDDVASVLSGCVRETLTWMPADQLDPSVLLAVLASALGIHEPGVTYDQAGLPRPRQDEWRDPTDEVPVRAPSPAEYAWAAPVLIAHLLGRGRLGSYLDVAFAEIFTAETMEMP